ncbi:ABC transporter permease [Haloarcula amylovorans]|uniref:ABC transporter permease n=1 Tax=Haloarcula amylovorans TaxID=2562280 RepID=UPI0010760F1F|nr:ABC transporter permease [Halomicroarcula amylolytica]
MTRLFHRLRAMLGLGGAHLRHDRGRTILAVLGVAVAVLATTVLASVGVGVVETGTQKFDTADRDLWVTGGPIQFAPESVGGVENGIVDAHQVSTEIESRKEVRAAVPLAFQTVYVGTNTSEFKTMVAAGVPGGGPSVDITKGPGFERDDVHYANGTYNGPMTRAIVLDPQTAQRFGVEPGDTLYVGGTIAGAKENAFTVVGISPTYSRFLGTGTATMHLSELQSLSGTTGADRATLVTIRLEDGVSAGPVKQTLQQQYPTYTVRTNREQLQATLERQALVVASGISLVVLAVLAGTALTVNLLLSFIYQQRRELAALNALGCSPTTLTGVVVSQAILLSIVGSIIGLLTTYPVVAGLNYVTAAIVGFENLVHTPPLLLPIGFSITIGMSLVSAIVAGWRLSRLEPMSTLRS